VIHVTTGRVRIKVDREDITEEFAREVQRALAPLPGIREVRISPLSGSIVLQYDPDEFELTRFMELARAANVLDLQGPPPDDLDFYAPLPASSTAQRIQRTFHEVDVRLAELTAGRWDMRTVVPVAFGVLAIRQLVANGVQLAAVPWYVLGWYAFDSFWKLNQDAHRSDEARVVASPAEDEP
jgi:hypothetical protein